MDHHCPCKSSLTAPKARTISMLTNRTYRQKRDQSMRKTLATSSSARWKPDQCLYLGERQVGLYNQRYFVLFM